MLADLGAGSDGAGEGAYGSCSAKGNANNLATDGDVDESSL